MDNKNHITKGCKKGEFQCESDGNCIDGYKVCNNYNDCSDHSDEQSCDIEDEYTGNAHFTLHKTPSKDFFILWFWHKLKETMFRI